MQSKLPLKVHHHNSGGRKSLSPKDGQRALDNSVKVDVKHRVAIEDGKFVVLRITRQETKEYHGYLLTIGMIYRMTSKKVLRNSGITNHKGKILETKNT